MAKIKTTEKFTYYMDDDGCVHNENGPAVVWVSGSQQWYIHDVLHNEFGPASIFIDADGKVRKSYYINGIELTKEAFLEYRINKNQALF